MKGCWILLLFLVLIQYKGSAQCVIDKSIITNNSWRTTVHHARYIGNAPSYVFTPGGDTATKWNVFRKPIDVKQMPEKARDYKKKVEDAIIQYSGKRFFNDLKFLSAEVVYPERVDHFRQNGRGNILQTYTATYLYTYRMEVDSLAYVDFEMPVNANGDLIDTIFIPRKGTYKPVIKKVDYCKLLKTASNKVKDILPVKYIAFQYNIKSKKFEWVIVQKLINSHIMKGNYSVNKVSIDAANLSKAEAGFEINNVTVDAVKVPVINTTD